MGRGTRIRFWYDTWCVEVALMNAFSSLYKIALDKDASVVDNMDISFGSPQWFVRFIRVAQDWEMGDITKFYIALYVLNLNVGREDRLLWIHLGNKNFSVNSFYKVMSIHSTIVFPWKSIWRSNVPVKVAFFGWLASHGKILTTDKLRKHSDVVTDWCFMR